MFLISRLHHRALLHSQALILDQLIITFMGSYFHSCFKTHLFKVFSSVPSLLLCMNLLEYQPAGVWKPLAVVVFQLWQIKPRQLARDLTVY